MKSVIRIAGVAAALLLTSSAFASVSVYNGDFSNPGLAAGQWIAGGSGAYGWYNDAAGDWVEIGKSSVYGLPSANAAGQNLEVNGNASPGTVYQDISGFTVGKYYTLSWLYGGRGGSTGPDTKTVVSIGGVDLQTDTGSEGYWTAEKATFKALSGTERLAFTGYTPFCNGTCGNEITNVTISVPEPSTWAMMLAGFGALAFAGYRRKGAIAA